MRSLFILSVIAAALVAVAAFAHPTDGSICPMCTHVATKAGNYTVVDSDDVILVTATATITMPACDSTRTGRTFSFARNGAAIVVTVTRVGGDTFAGGATTNLLGVDLAGKSYTCDGAGTWIVR